MKPQISNLEINAFRGLKNVALSDLGMVNLIVGFNNSGKSSILEAIEYFCRPLDPLALITLSRSREVSARNFDPVQTLRWLFPKTTVAPDGDFYELNISVTGQVNNVNKTVETILIGHLADVYFGPAVNIDGTSTDVPTTPPPAANFQKNVLDLRCLYYTGVTTKPSEALKNANFSIIEGRPFSMHKAADAPAINCSMITPITHRIDSLQTRGITTAIKADRKEDLLDLVRLFDSEIKEITILDSNGYPEAWINHKQRGFMPLSSFGDGMRRALVVASGLSISKGGVLLVDEIESAIHKDAFAKFFNWLFDVARASKVQIFATTHSQEALDAMLSVSLKRPDELVAYHLPDHHAKTKVVKRFAGEILESIRYEQGFDIR